jgi:hypothetical protein
LNPKPLFQCIAIPTPLYFFQVTWSGPKLFFDPLRLVLYFPGRCGHAASATTATAGPIGPIGPVGPIGPIGPRRCRHIIFSRLEELHPGPGNKLLVPGDLDPITLLPDPVILLLTVICSR